MKRRVEAPKLLKLFLVVALVLFFAAKLLPSLGGRLGTQARKPFRQAKWMWSWFAGTEAEALDAEREYGRECAREFATQFPASPPIATQKLVDAVGAKLEKAVGDPRREFRFSVVCSAKVNAYALPGGFVFVTNALVDLCGSDPDEVAFLLGHEIGHILGGHAKDQLTASACFGAVTARLPGAGSMITEVLGKGYSRELELEADRNGARLARAAGFDAAAGRRVLERLARMSPQDPEILEYFSSHPPFEERIREVESTVRG